MDALDLSELLTFLLARKPPVTEPDLLRRFIPGSEDVMLGGVSAALYRAHFTLYHHLFLLSHSLERTKYYLHINLIYVYLLEKPGSGRCRFFDDTSCRFCGVSTVNGSELCARHREREAQLLSERTMDFPGMAGFYLDESNLESIDETELRKFEKEVYYYAAHYREIDSSLRIMELPIDCSLERLRSRYRYLSKRYHPDTGGSPGPVAFSEITNAYNVLLKLKT